MDIVITEEWKNQVESGINEMVLNFLQEQEANRLMLNQTPIRFTEPSAENYYKIASLNPRGLSKLPDFEYIVDLINGTVSNKLKIEGVAFILPNGAEIPINLYGLLYNGNQFRLCGLSILASDYIGFAEECNYRIAVECGSNSFDGAELIPSIIFWYINDLKGAKKKNAPPLMIGSRNYLIHPVSLGMGSDPGLNLHGIQGARYASDAIKYFGLDNPVAELPFFEL